MAESGKGDPDKSLLFKAVSYIDSDLAMPPEEKLPTAVIAAFRRWVEMGAPWPEEESPTFERTEKVDWSKLRQQHWA